MLLQLKWICYVILMVLWLAQLLSFRSQLFIQNRLELCVIVIAKKLPIVQWQKKSQIWITLMRRSVFYLSTKFPENNFFFVRSCLQRDKPGNRDKHNLFGRSNKKLC